MAPIEREPAIMLIVFSVMSISTQIGPLQVLDRLAACNAALAPADCNVLGNCLINRLLIFGQAGQPTGNDATDNHASDQPSKPR